MEWMNEIFRLVYEIIAVVRRRYIFEYHAPYHLTDKWLFDAGIVTTL